MKYNIFEMGNENSNQLKACYDAIKDKHEKRGSLYTLEAFISMIENRWTVSMNMDLLGLYGFLKSERHKNVYEHANEENINISDLLKNWKEKRIAFDQAFEGGELFRYGALNIGGIGIRNFGEFCIVFKRIEADKYQTLAFLKYDSLKVYVDDNCQIDIKKLSQEISNRDYVHILAILKHNDDICPNTDPLKWSEMVCSEASYVEAITQDNIYIHYIEIIRIHNDDKKRFEENFFNNTYGSANRSIEKRELKLYTETREIMNEKNIRLEVINGNNS